VAEFLGTQRWTRQRSTAATGAVGPVDGARLPLSARATGCCCR